MHITDLILQLKSKYVARRQNLQTIMISWKIKGCETRTPGGLLIPVLWSMHICFQVEMRHTHAYKNRNSHKGSSRDFENTTGKL